MRQVDPISFFPQKQPINPLVTIFFPTDVSAPLAYKLEQFLSTLLCFTGLY